MSPPRLVIAIDFGTHASGFAWAWLDERAKPAGERTMTLFRDWPGAQVLHYFKTRTALLRSASGEIIAWGNEAYIKYRREQRRGSEGLLQYRDGFKLDLVSSDTSERDRAVKDTADYLALLRKEALAITQKFAGNVPEEWIRWCITMPVNVVEGLEGYDSIFRDQVAGPAGFPAADREKFILALEPEAAALCCQEKYGMPNERFTVMDAGGGTVDITTLQINDDSTLDQIGFQAGGKLGSRFLNVRFAEMVFRRLVERQGWQQTAAADSEDWATIMMKWEEDKRTWDFASKESYYVRVPRRADDGADHGPMQKQSIENSNLVLSSEEILGEIFEPLVTEILRQLDEALAELPEGPPIRQVLLVGGFGGSPFLQRRLGEHLADRASLVSLPDPMSGEAVLRGAVHYALDPKWIHARRMQYTYGCDFYSSCKRPQEKHQTEHRRIRYTRWGEEHERCLQLLVFARRGEVIDTGTVRKVMPLYPADGRQRTVPFNLYASADLDPYFVEDCKLVGSIQLPTRIPWWRSIFWRPIDIEVTLGETEVIFRASDRQRPDIYREIRLRYFKEDPDVPD